MPKGAQKEHTRALDEICNRLVWDGYYSFFSVIHGNAPPAVSDLLQFRFAICFVSGKIQQKGGSGDPHNWTHNWTKQAMNKKAGSEQPVKSSYRVICCKQNGCTECPRPLPPAYYARIQVAKYPTIILVWVGPGNRMAPDDLEMCLPRMRDLVRMHMDRRDVDLFVGIRTDESGQTVTTDRRGTAFIPPTVTTGSPTPDGTYLPLSEQQTLRPQLCLKCRRYMTSEEQWQTHCMHCINQVLGLPPAPMPIPTHPPGVRAQAGYCSKCTRLQVIRGLKYCAACCPPELKQALQIDPMAHVANPLMGRPAGVGLHQFGFPSLPGAMGFPHGIPHQSVQFPTALVPAPPAPPQYQQFNQQMHQPQQLYPQQYMGRQSPPQHQMPCNPRTLPNAPPPPPPQQRQPQPVPPGSPQFQQYRPAQLRQPAPFQISDAAQHHFSMNLLAAPIQSQAANSHEGQMQNPIPLMPSDPLTQQQPLPLASTPPLGPQVPGHMGEMLSLDLHRMSQTQFGEKPQSGMPQQTLSTDALQIHHLPPRMMVLEDQQCDDCNNLGELPLSDEPAPVLHHFVFPPVLQDQAVQNADHEESQLEFGLPLGASIEGNTMSGLGMNDSADSHMELDAMAHSFADYGDQSYFSIGTRPLPRAIHPHLEIHTSQEAALRIGRPGPHYFKDKMLRPPVKIPWYTKVGRYFCRSTTTEDD